VRKYFSHSNPIGQRVTIRDSNGYFDFVIVGVAADSKHGSVREKPFPRFYAPFFNPVGNTGPTYATFMVRTFGSPAAVISSIRAAVKDVAANLPPVTTETMDQQLADSLATDRMITEFSGAFGALAIILVCVGLYGIMAYAVSSHTNEIGSRMALGAQRQNILWLILRESLLLVCVEVVIAVPVVFAVGKWISSLLFGVKAADPLAITGGCLDVPGGHRGVLRAGPPRHARRSYRRLEIRIVFHASHQQGPLGHFLRLFPSDEQLFHYGFQRKGCRLFGQLIPHLATIC
jgi:ABC-type antimicrobial peptide transport system permease subunit